MSITARRLAPLLIATSLATAGLALTTTAAHAAPTHTTTGVTTDSSNPLLDALRRSGNLTKIDNNNTANGGDTQPPTSGSSGPGKGGCGFFTVDCGGGEPQPPSNDDTNPPTGGAGGTDGSEQGDGGSGNADLGPSEFSDYATWTDPGPDSGPVVN
ncbi:MULTISPECIES: hypothetical protein [unclassified Streptomyces]|uniref:hypothetical protein n=1 Tax=unclassified Streptomyces TaxID=2593676 RepID=UPI002887EAF5|nr:hypothetical protein [Streptomyces sp. DSM 41633]